MMRFLPFLVALCLVTPGPLRADETLAGKACRSVHLNYPAAEGSAFVNEVTVDRSAPGTYFCVCGFSAGYFGLQELGNGKKLLIFSVWDPTKGDDPTKVPAEKRVQLRHRDEKVRVGRFGGEGTGGQSFFDYDWKLGTSYRFLVTATPDGADRTAYAGWFFVPEDKAWKHLVTFSTLSQGKLLRGYYSFVEDFRRNGESAKRQRQAHYGNGWVKTKADTWEALTKARFTADSNPALTIDATVDRELFVLTTGGETKNSGTPLRGTLESKPGTRPDVPAP